MPWDQGFTSQEPDPRLREPIGGTYQGPAVIDDTNLPPPLPGASIEPERPGYDPRERNDPNIDYAKMDLWIAENVHAKGLTVDIATGEIIDYQTGEVVGTLPTFYKTN